MKRTPSPICIDKQLFKRGLHPVRTRTGKRNHLLDPRCLDKNYTYPSHPLCGGGRSRSSYRFNRIAIVKSYDGIYIDCARCLKIHQINERKGGSPAAVERPSSKPLVRAQSISMPDELASILKGHVVCDVLHGEYMLAEGVLVMTTDAFLFCRSRLGDWQIQKEDSLSEVEEVRLVQKGTETVLEIETVSGTRKYQKLEGDAQAFVQRFHDAFGKQKHMPQQGEFEKPRPTKEQISFSDKTEKSNINVSLGVAFGILMAVLLGAILFMV